MTLAVLADLSGLSVPFLSMVENGQRTLSRRDHINALAAALRVAPAEIAPGTIPGFNEWAPSPHAPVLAFPAMSDEIVLARHRDLARKLMGFVARGDTCAAGTWLRRAARDPSVNPWLLLDRLTTYEISKSGPHSRLPGKPDTSGTRPGRQADQARGMP